MSALKLVPFDVNNLDVFSNQAKIRRDLHVFFNYVGEKSVKRSHRENSLSKAVSTRLAKLMSDPSALKWAKEDGSSGWVDFVDRQCLRLKFVDYDTKGRYMGYTSSEPSYPDNYINCNSNVYKGFLDLSLNEQERRILDILITDYGDSNNEFFQTNIFGQLDTFASRGCATGVVPTLNFPKIRRFLLNILKDCECGIWYSTRSLVRYLKEYHPFFLIPRKFTTKYKHEKTTRYDNFCEREIEDKWGRGEEIQESDPDAFERVEGRYVERFLENIPLIMRYVDVAYSKNMESDISPCIDKLRAFRVNERLKKTLNGEIPEPVVTVLPNFEIYIHSPSYPTKLISMLSPLAEIASEDKTVVMKLQKRKVAQHLAKHEGADVVGLLQKLSSKDIPQWGYPLDSGTPYM